MQQILQRSHCCCSATSCLKLWQQCFRHGKSELWVLRRVLSFRVSRTVTALHREERTRCSTLTERFWLTEFNSSLLKVISEELAQIWSRSACRVTDHWMLCRSDWIQSIRRANDSLLIFIFQVCLFFWFDCTKLTCCRVSLFQLWDFSYSSTTSTLNSSGIWESWKSSDS